MGGSSRAGFGAVPWGFGLGTSHMGSWGSEQGGRSISGVGLVAMCLLCSMCTNSSQVICRPEEGELPSAASPVVAGPILGKPVGPWMGGGGVAPLLGSTLWSPGAQTHLRCVSALGGCRDTSCFFFWGAGLLWGISITLSPDPASAFWRDSLYSKRGAPGQVQCHWSICWLLVGAQAHLAFPLPCSQ